MSKKFELFESMDRKRLFVQGPCEMSIEIDYDDVDHETVDREVFKLLDLLNKRWKKS